MNLVIVGNGILGLQTAYKVVEDDPGARITVVGPFSHPGCASLAAAAMFNSFCEIDSGTLSNTIERKKFEFNRASNHMWPELLSKIEREAGRKLNSGFGTYLINNTVSDGLEDENFNAIASALQQYNEPFDWINPVDIPFYLPSPPHRASRALLIKREGWVNPVQLLECLKVILEKSGRVNFVNDSAEKIETVNNRVESIRLASGGKVSGDQYLLCPGATFSELISKSELGIRLIKIFYGVGSSILLNTKENTLTNCIRTPNRGLACGVYSAPQSGTHTLVGASNFISPTPVENVRLTSVYTLAKAAMEQINTNFYRSELVKVNVGWRPTSADTLPLIGRTSIQNLVVATGTKRDGLHCSPVISRDLSRILMSREPEYDLSLFAPERQPVVIYTRKEAIDIAVRHTMNAAYQHDFVPAKNRMTEDLARYYRSEYEQLHDKVGADTWGIPPEMLDMYKYKHLP